MSSVGYGFGQFGADGFGLSIVSRQLTGALTSGVGQTSQLALVDIYSDGSEVALAGLSWASSNPAVASVTQDGLVTCLQSGEVTITIESVGSAIYSAVFVVEAQSLVSIAITGTVSTLLVGQQQQLTAIGTYNGGSTQDLTTRVSWNSSSPGAAVNSAGMVTALLTSVVNISASIGDVFGVFTLTVSLLGAPVQATTVPKFRSHLTQVLQNYFDWKDSRIRRGRYTLDAQLLNLGAQQIQLSSLRLARELGATTLHRCPANIDNGGCYWQQRLPGTFNFGLSSHVITATRSGTSLALGLYQDELPVPSRVTLNSAQTPVPFTAPLLISFYGMGNTTTQSWSAQRSGPLASALGNRLQFWLDGPGYFALNVKVKITGQKAPAPAWSDGRSVSTETVSATKLGWFQSKFAWSSIQQVLILGLPVGVTLSVYEGSFLLPMQPDVIRPYIDPMFRDASFDRYWSTDGSFLTEQYLGSDYAGWRYAQSYSTASPLSSVAVEPNTWGAFAASGTTLYYFDRREPLPTNLSASAITQEPYYGLEVIIDEDQVEPIRFVVLTPVPYANAPNAGAYRFLVTTPDKNTYVITPTGMFAEYSRTAGWRHGVPQTLTIPLAETGTFVFSLQVIGSDGSIVQDSTPWPNLAFTPLATFDLSSLVSEIEGISFDDRNRLLVWTGTETIALDLHYDGYVLDQASQSIYLTDPVDGLTVDGLTL